MANKGGGTKLKRQMAPNFWSIERKHSRFVPKVSPGPHSASSAYPLGVVLRDILKVCNTMHEANLIVIGRRVKIDGRICLDVNRGVGLMDVLEFNPTGEAFRFVAKDSDVLHPIPIPRKEATSKIAKISRKIKIKGGKLQYSFHEVKTTISEKEMNVGDSCILSLPELEIISRIKFEAGCSALITRGENAGVIGKVEDVREGIFSLPKRALISFGNRSVELPIDIVIPVGAQEPSITVR